MAGPLSVDQAGPPSKHPSPSWHRPARHEPLVQLETAEGAAGAILFGSGGIVARPTPMDQAGWRPLYSKPEAQSRLQHDCGGVAQSSTRIWRKRVGNGAGVSLGVGGLGPWGGVRKGHDTRGAVGRMGSLHPSPGWRTHTAQSRQALQHSVSVPRGQHRNWRAAWRDAGWQANTARFCSTAQDRAGGSRGQFDVGGVGT